MSIAIPFIALLLVGAIAAYHRLRLPVWAALSATVLVAAWMLGANGAATLVAGLLLALVAVPLLLPQIRLPFITAPLLKFYTRILPTLSETEQVALEAGTVGFEGELFSGKPDWHVLLDQPRPMLTAQEQAFLDGPVEQLCRMTNDWEITHVLADLPPEMWEFIKTNRFFGMIVPKEYGGLGFSALANHKVIQKLSSISSVVSSTVGVPNSLGPAELLMHYGTQEQKDHYLPRLANGREVPWHQDGEYWPMRPLAKPSTSTRPPALMQRRLCSKISPPITSKITSAPRPSVSALTRSLKLSRE